MAHWAAADSAGVGGGPRHRSKRILSNGSLRIGGLSMAHRTQRQTSSPGEEAEVSFEKWRVSRPTSVPALTPPASTRQRGPSSRDAW
jgi:hypothetical protein